MGKHGFSLDQRCPQERPLLRPYLQYYLDELIRKGVLELQVVKRQKQYCKKSFM
jgi:hypothetical protein